jgi:L-rhamnose-H+ transport protein
MDGTSMPLGFLFVVLGAVCGGSFGLPSKFVRKDTPWETLWGPFFLFVTVLLPVTLGPVLVADFYAIFKHAGIGVLVAPLVFGFFWGLGSMTLGLSFAFIGLSLAYSLNYGAQIMFGSLAPMLIHTPGEALTPHGGVILGGVAVCLLGVIVSGRAGILKDRSLKGNAAHTPQESEGRGKPKAAVGLVIGVLSGVLCACYAVAASFAGPVFDAAVAAGNPPWRAAFAVTAIILWGGALSACGYCALQLTRNGTWPTLARPGVGRVLGLALVMALLHDGAIFLFGLGYMNLGTLGVSVGYAAFMSFAIIVGNIHGFRTGEWKGASRRSKTWIMAGIAILIAGVCVLAAGNQLRESASPAAAPVTPPAATEMTTP